MNPQLPVVSGRQVIVSGYMEAKLCGIQCHTTQVGRRSPFAEAPDEVIREPWVQTEHFPPS
jgi:LmbE family N-acetylglucosaminyl deacetylase